MSKYKALANIAALGKRPAVSYGKFIELDDNDPIIKSGLVVKYVDPFAVEHDDGPLVDIFVSEEKIAKTKSVHPSNHKAADKNDSKP